MKYPKCRDFFIALCSGGLLFRGTNEQGGADNYYNFEDNVATLYVDLQPIFAKIFFNKKSLILTCSSQPEWRKRVL